MKRFKNKKFWQAAVCTTIGMLGSLTGAAMVFIGEKGLQLQQYSIRKLTQGQSLLYEVKYPSDGPSEPDGQA